MVRFGSFINSSVTTDDAAAYIQPPYRLDLAKDRYRSILRTKSKLQLRLDRYRLARRENQYIAHESAVYSCFDGLACQPQQIYEGDFLHDLIAVRCYESSKKRLPIGLAITITRARTAAEVAGWLAAESGQLAVNQFLQNCVDDVVFEDNLCGHRVETSETSSTAAKDATVRRFSE